MCAHNDTVSMTVPGVRSDVEYCLTCPAVRQNWGQLWPNGQGVDWEIGPWYEPAAGSEQAEKAAFMRWLYRKVA